MSGRNIGDPWLEELLARHRESVERMPLAARDHMRHEQRISFAYGNVALTYEDPTDEALEKIYAGAVKAAGDCPCLDCDVVRRFRGLVLLGSRRGGYLVENGETCAGEIEAP